MNVQQSAAKEGEPDRIFLGNGPLLSGSWRVSAFLEARIGALNRWFVVPALAGWRDASRLKAGLQTTAGSCRGRARSLQPEGWTTNHGGVIRGAGLSLSVAVLIGCRVLSLGATVPPKPLPDHPGNVFLEGEDVVVRPAGTGTAWTLADYDERERQVSVTNGALQLGRLPVGFYRLRQAGNPAWTSLAVLQPLAAPTPSNSPIGLDVAMAWFYPKDKMEAAASLCVLAGVNWVRDRLSWGELETSRSQWAGENRYDLSAKAQSLASLRILQVNHASPTWANPNHKRFPLDLRDAYRFQREIARRWQGRVLAFEPWNEADIDVFGGHTGAEMATMQKASYLGLKAGNTAVVGCLNVFALHNRSQLEDLHDNRAWAYFDTFNLHHYDTFDNYPKLYADFREFSAGRPLWVTECAVPVKWAGDEKLKEPTDADLRVQSERIAKVFACALHEGAANVFYFLLPHYVEGQTQFGILRPDLTPRPAYVALGAAGRLLADAKPLGRLDTTNAALRAFLFRAWPGGRPRDVLVAWSTDGQQRLNLPSLPVSMADHLGRPLEPTTGLTLKTAPVFAVFAEGVGRQIRLQPAPGAPPALEGTASPMVLQAQWPADKVELKRSAYRVEAGQLATIPVFLYNFSERPASGRITVEAPASWKARLQGVTEVASMGRAELRLEVETQEVRPGSVEKVRFQGDFGEQGQVTLCLRLVSDPRGLLRGPGTRIRGSSEASRWTQMISGPGPMLMTNRQDGLTVQAEPGGSDRWVYPRLELQGTDRAPAGALGMACTLVVEEGEGQFRAIFDEANGSSYVVDVTPQPGRGRTVEVMALFENTTHGEGWSKPDANGKLDPAEIASLKIGCNTKSGKVAYRLSNLRWLTP
jgi:hypothetical protein